MKKKLNFEFRIAITYLIFGVCWIIFTDIFLDYFVENSLKWTQVQSTKGIVFVLFSTIIIYFLSRRYSKQQLFIKKHLQESKVKAEESDRLKSNFLANMSHEIRTPMNGILGFVRLLEESNLDEDQFDKYLGFVKKSSDRLLDTINDIIEISKIESEQVVLNITEVDVNESVNFLYGFYKPDAERKGLTFVLNNRLLEEKVVIRTDKNKLESILTNFIKNAIKFTHQGTIEFGCNKNNGQLLFYVKDSGIGIPKERQEVIFERFIQSDLTVTKPYEGSGLGLAIAKAYATMLNGQIGVDSAEGKGSTFWFSMKNTSSAPD